MTYDEVSEKFGGEKVKFVSYYKYSFVYGNGSISVHLGGDRDDIYRAELTNVCTVNKLFAQQIVRSIYQDGNEIYSAEVW